MLVSLTIILGMLAGLLVLGLLDGVLWSRTTTDADAVEASVTPLARPAVVEGSAPLGSQTNAA